MKFKDEQIRSVIIELMWGDGAASIVSRKTGVEVSFQPVSPVYRFAFESVFDPSGMSEEQISKEESNRREALKEASSTYHSGLWCINEFKKFKKKVLAELK